MMDNVSIPAPSLTSTKLVGINIPDGKVAEVTIKKIKDIPAFYMVGNGLLNSKLPKGTPVMDFMKEAMSMTPQEQWLVLQLKENLQPEEYRTADNKIKLRTTCKVGFKSGDLSKADKRKLLAGYKRLREKDIVRRIKKEYYMFNPVFLIPTEFDEEMDLYSTLK